MDDYIETTARWGKSFVEIINPTQENLIFRAYFEQPKREWVGLTDEDCDEVERWVEFKEEGSGRIPTSKLIQYIEFKLKERNT